MLVLSVNILVVIVCDQFMSSSVHYWNGWCLKSHDWVFRKSRKDGYNEQYICGDGEFFTEHNAC